MTPPTHNPEALLSQTRWVRRLALRLVRDPDLADDLAQETYLAALRHRPDEGRSLRGWLATVLRNLVRQQARGLSRRTDRERLVSRGEETDSTLDLVERIALHKQVVEAATSLTEPYRETILLRYFEEYTPSEIALRTGVPLATVKTRLSRGLERLREHLDSEHQGDRSAWSVALLALAQPPGGTACAGAAKTIVGAAIVSTQLKLVAAVVLVAAGLYAVWPSDAEVQKPDQPSVSAAAPEPDEVEGNRTQQLNIAAPEGERVELDAQVDAPSGSAGPVANVNQAPLVPSPLQGLVLDSEGIPASGVPLMLQSTAGSAESVKHTRSGAGGRFRFESVISGTVVAEGTEWVTVFSGLGASTRKNAEPVVVVARRQALAGRVVDDMGFAVEGARVQTRLPRGFRGRFHEIMDFSSTVANSAITDADGRFELPDTPGVTEATLSATKVGFQSYSEPQPEQSDLALTLVLERQTALSGGILAGKVVDAQGWPVPDAQVAFGVDATLTDEYGIFRFEVGDEDSMNGQFAGFMNGYQPARLLAMKPGLLPARMDATPAAEGDALVWPEDIVMVLRGEPKSISGRVVNSAGDPRPGVRVWVAETTLFSMDRQGGVIVENFLAGREETRWAFEVTDSEGRFEIPGLMDHAYTLVAMDVATLYREEVADVAAGRSGVELVMRDGRLWPRVSGRVVGRDGLGVSGVNISPQTDAKRLRYAGQVIGTNHGSADGVMTDEDGSFVLERVPRDLVYLRLDGEDIISHEYGRGDRSLATLAGESIEDLRIVVGLRVHLQVMLEDPARGSHVVVLDAEGERLRINVIQGNSRKEGFAMPIEGGRTDVLTVSDSAATLVLQLDGEEVARQELILVRGEVTQVRL